ncbi:MAG: radical SAM protein, partial [Candidatus Woesearchaeota archaeon]
MPFKHKFFRYKHKEFNELILKEDKKFIENRILVKKDYYQNLKEFYEGKINEPNPQLMYIITTDECNFNCDYCFIEGNYENKKRDKLDFKTAKKWIDYLYENTKTKEPAFIFYGGEPLLNSRLVKKLIKYIRKCDKKYDFQSEIGINTNGSIYTKELSNLFKKYNTNLAISIDGPKTINDKFRKDSTYEGTYDKITKNIDKYLENNVTVTLSITINKHNINVLPAIARWVIKRFPKIDNVGFNPPLNSKSFKKGYDFEKIMFSMYNAFRIFKKNGIYEDRIMRRMDPIINEKPYLKDCAGCGNQIVLSPNGKIGPCHGFL